MQISSTAKEDNVISSNYKMGAYFYDAIVFLLQLFVGGVNKWRNSVVALADPLADEKILELCCGTGSISIKIKKHINCKVYASDLSPDQIKIARRKAKKLKQTIEFSVQDASNTSYPSSFFDKVIISGALHEIKKERRLAIYKEIQRLLKNKGSFIASEPDRPEKGWGLECFEFIFGKWNPEHETVYELSHNGLESELADLGFLHEKSCTSNYGIFKSRAFKIDKSKAKKHST